MLLNRVPGLTHDQVVPVAWQTPLNQLTGTACTVVKSRMSEHTDDIRKGRHAARGSKESGTGGF